MTDNNYTTKPTKKLPYKRKIGNQVEIVQTAAVKNDPLVNSIVNQLPSDSDPSGSYTGRPMNENDIPVQDADDL